MATKLCAYCLRDYHAALPHCPWCDAQGHPRRSKIARFDAGEPPPAPRSDTVRVERGWLDSLSDRLGTMVSRLNYLDSSDNHYLTERKELDELVEEIDQRLADSHAGQMELPLG